MVTDWDRPHDRTLPSDEPDHRDLGQALQGHVGRAAVAADGDAVRIRAAHGQGRRQGDLLRQGPCLGIDDVERAVELVRHEQVAPVRRHRQALGEAGQPERAGRGPRRPAGGRGQHDRAGRARPDPVAPDGEVVDRVVAAAGGVEAPPVRREDHPDVEVVEAVLRAGRGVVRGRDGLDLVHAAGAQVDHAERLVGRTRAGVTRGVPQVDGGREVIAVRAGHTLPAVRAIAVPAAVEPGTLPAVDGHGEPSVGRNGDAEWEVAQVDRAPGRGDEATVRQHRAVGERARGRGRAGRRGRGGGRERHGGDGEQQDKGGQMPDEARAHDDATFLGASTCAARGGPVAEVESATRRCGSSVRGPRQRR